MIVVADSGPLHYLILLDHADLLRRFYGEVIVPDAVAIELSSPSAPSIVRDWILRPPPWVKVAQSYVASRLQAGPPSTLRLFATKEPQKHRNLLVN